MKQDNTPHPIDIHVGMKVRVRRKTIGMSQQELAQNVGVTFQQVQKYESGANRISSSKLYEMSQALGVSVSYLFEGLDDGHTDDPTDNGFVTQIMRSNSGMALVKAFLAIKDHNIKSRIVSLVEALAGKEGKNHD